MKKNYDAAIIGAGPAGLSSAITLAQKGWRVLVLDKAFLPREKVCGGFIGPENLPVLESLGVMPELSAAGVNKVARVGLSAANGASVKMPIHSGGASSHGLAISRKKLDEVLVARAKELGVDVFDGVKVVSINEENGFRMAVSVCKSNQVEMFQACHLIHAGGAAQDRTRSQKALGFGVFAMFKNVRDMQEDVFLHFINKGHLGINRFEGGLTNVCYMADKDLFDSVKGDADELYRLFLDENPHVMRQLSGAERVTPWKGVFVPGPGAPVFNRGRAFCVGDAVDVIHPIAGSGISLALSGGRLLAALMTQYRPDELPFEKVVRRYEKAWKKNFLWRIRFSRLWGRLGHNQFLANSVMKLFSYQKNIFDRVFEFHHRQMRWSSDHLIKESVHHAVS